jgi:DNA mismatch endonuclease Vsr
MDSLTAEQRRKNMQAVKASGSKIETTLAKALFADGLRHRKNDKSVFGKPDLTFKKYKIAIFVDSEFFHGKDWNTNKHRINTNREFWWAKIESNISRDKLVNLQLNAEGWKILRFWGKDVEKSLRYCINKIERLINKRNNADKVFRN